MSGMEALAAFGLACNVMQTIGFALETVKVCKEVFRTGSLDRSKAERVAESLKASESFNKWMLSASPMTESQREVLDLAEKAQNATLELKKEVDKLTSPSAKGKVITTIKHTFRAGLKEKDIIKLEKKTEEWRRILESRLLVQICQKNDAIFLQGEAGFNELDETMRKFILAFSRGQTHIEDLLDRNRDSINDVTRAQALKSQQTITATVVSESSKTRTEIASIAKAIVEAEPPMWSKRQRLLSSFRYDSMNLRVGRIPEPHPGTYQWIIRGVLMEEEPEYGEEPQNRPHSASGCCHNTAILNVPWKCFPCWLEAGPPDKIYWIQGKPGSGKSTLVKFMVFERDLWSTMKANGKNPLVLSHFLWAAGDPIQRSIRGILLALISQFLTANEACLDEVINTFPRIWSKDGHNDWSKEELRKIADTWFPKSERPVFIFLDGLDEISTSDNDIDTAADLVRLVKGLANLANVKVCVSSRPEPLFVKQLGNMSTLRLQDLTRYDMKAYVEAYLLQPQLDPDESEGRRKLVDAICDKADGVFLWAAIAVRRLSRGLDNDEDLTDLEARLMRMPSGLFPLYEDMWSRLDEDRALYRSKAAVYFNMVRDWSKMSSANYTQGIELFHIMAGSNSDKSKAILQDYSTFSADELDAASRDAAKRLETRTAGLLEVRWGRGNKYNRVEFIHRSALEFFENTEEGRQLLTYDPNPPRTRHANLLQAFLAGVWLRVTKHYDIGVSRDDTCAVLERIHNAWDQDQISRDDTIFLLSSCKTLFETGHWCSSVYSVPDNLPLVDFAGLSAAFGLHKFVSFLTKSTKPGCEGDTLSALYNTYLLVAALANPQVGGSYEPDFAGKSRVVSLLLEDRPVIIRQLNGASHAISTTWVNTRGPSASDTTSGSSGGTSTGGASTPRTSVSDDGARSAHDLTMEQVNLLVLLSILNSRSPWPSTLPSIPEIIARYIDAHAPSLDEKIVVMLVRFEVDDDDRWLIDIECVGAKLDRSSRQFKHYVTFEMDLRFLLHFFLRALAAGRKDAVTAATADSLLSQLRESEFANRQVKVIGFNLTIPSFNKVVKPLSPASSEDAESIAKCLDYICPDTTVEASGASGLYEIPGLWARLEAVALRAREVEEDVYENVVVDNTVHKLVKGFMSSPPKMFVD
ncbi:hypothetical protein B0T22DRAFT_303000 [Podospora appendiculata]|uniref:NACHT domain-containing protein n=1 Tax=Podospora appendiculata TaxID=314037 RepID=A0AAE1C7A4_9PEZI|nr:hypothetical protein B0T22DRAFT_303000 [Podospora appendiculata]